MGGVGGTLTDTPTTNTQTRISAVLQGCGEIAVALDNAGRVTHLRWPGTGAMSSMSPAGSTHCARWCCRTQ